MVQKNTICVKNPIANPLTFTNQCFSMVALKASFPSLGGSNGKEAACNAGDPRSIPGSRKSPVEGNGNPL